MKQANESFSDEHYRRSPGCAFFVFAGSTAPKTGGGKKARGSKGSRLSTQSNATTTSQAPSIPKLDDSIDVSSLSQETVLSTVPRMAGKKPGKGRGRPTRVKSVDPVEELQTSGQAVDAGVIEQVDAIRRGTKRKSEDISEDHSGLRESTTQPEAQPKRRATRNRTSQTQQLAYPVLDTWEVAQQKPVRGSRKRASSRNEKPSTNLAATAPSPGDTISDKPETEALLEADLAKAMADGPEFELDAVKEPSKSKTRSRAKKTKVSTAPTRNTRQVRTGSEVPRSPTAGSQESPLNQKTKKEDKAILKGKVRKPRVTKKSVIKRSARSGRESTGSSTTIATNEESQLNSSLLKAQTIADDPGQGHDNDTSDLPQKPVKTKGSTRKANAKATGRKAGLLSKNIEDIVQTKSGPQLVANSAASAEPYRSSIIVEQNLTTHDESDEPAGAVRPKRITRATRGAKAKVKPITQAMAKLPQLSMPGTFSPLMRDADPSFNSVLATSSPPVAPATNSELETHTSVPVAVARASSPKLPEPVDVDSSIPAATGLTPAKKKTSPPQRHKNTNEATPSPSPQSSDAENQPPSSRPPSVRPPLARLSPSNGSLQRVSLVPGTPLRVPLSPSKIGGLQSAMPWTAVDVEMIFAPSPDKENRNIFADVRQTGLTSPEKTMSVEEWIKSQALGVEEKLKAEAERVVNIFEREGGRALGVLESIVAVE